MLAVSSLVWQSYNRPWTDWDISVFFIIKIQMHHGHNALKSTMVNNARPTPPFAYISSMAQHGRVGGKGGRDRYNWAQLISNVVRIVVLVVNGNVAHLRQIIRRLGETWIVNSERCPTVVAGDEYPVRATAHVGDETVACSDPRG